MPKGRPVAGVTITAEQRVQLESWSRRPKTAQGLALRSRMVLLAAAGQSNAAIAQQLAIGPHTVGKWPQRFLHADPTVCSMSRDQARRAQ
jgi:DNA-binding NarL/FixJ family response regulator